MFTRIRIDPGWAPHGIVFDMDGVLLDSSPMHDAAYRQALSEFPIPDFRYSRVAGMRSADGVLVVLREHGINLPSERVAALAAAKSRIALEHIAAANPIVPGVREVLAALSPRLKLAVASSASPAAVHSFLGRNGLQHFFGCAIHSGDVRSAKPSPEIFELAIERLGIEPRNALVVEDAVAGIQAAKAAGAVACGIASTCSADELIAAGADAMIDQLEDLLELGGGERLDSRVDPSLWTALVPAAGRGTRLGFDLPKILYPIAGATILEWLVDLLNPLCARFVFVVSPQGAGPVEKEASRLLGARQAIAVQPEPRGMADAIRCGLASVETRHTLIVWGDQVALRPESLDFAMRLHQGSAQPAATCPTLWRDRPYIHFERKSDKVVRILQAREGDAMPERGESDAGVFLFRTEELRSYLPRLLESGECIGAKTGELNFLPIFPILDRLITAPIMTEAESVGVNSPADAQYLERQLLTRAIPPRSTEPRPQGSE